jgi:hypothetical protein
MLTRWRSTATVRPITGQGLLVTNFLNRHRGQRPV